MKVKAHVALASCVTPEDVFRRGGNNLADHFAKQGAARHPVNRLLLDKLRRHERFLFDISGLMARSLDWRWRNFKDALKHLTSTAGAPAIVAAHRPVASRFFRGDPLAHRMCLDDSLRWRCTICMASYETSREIRRNSCGLAASYGRLHSLYSCGSFVFCVRCGFYSSVRARGLSCTCLPIPPDASDRRHRLGWLFTGTTPYQTFFAGHRAALEPCCRVRAPQCVREHH